nr:hypothetical protein GCM10020093_094760 [Planobispora longispora]
MSPIPRRRRTALIWAAALALMVPQGVAQAAPEPDKIDKAVLADLAADDKATFWVRMKSGADLSAARRATDKDEKARQVYRAKTETAAASQAACASSSPPRARASPLLDRQRRTGDRRRQAGCGDRQAARGGAGRAHPRRRGARAAAGQGGRARQRGRVEHRPGQRPRVWNELGSRGEGIVVANIDTGVQFDHPALADRYRGRNADGTLGHDYNWFDPAGVCPAAEPCDNNDHGTHTMGTMVGGEGANVIGVAPGARWIAAKGCESNTCTDASLLAAGQWVLAPTDLDGRNPRPDLAPHIVNNSWGGAGFDPWYKEIVEAWVAAGIFPAFSNGNLAGAGCNSSGSPGSTSPATAPARSTPATRSGARPPAAPARTARSSPTSPRPASTCARPWPRAATAPSPERRWPPRTWRPPWR